MPKWLEWLKQNIGKVTQTGAKPTPFVEEIFSHTNYGAIGNITPACCAATLCAALEETGYRSTKNAAALSFASYGVPCELKEGAIVVFEWSPGEHHVTCVDEIMNADFVACIGGNQSHQVMRKIYPRNQIIATRWPVVQ